MTALAIPVDEVSQVADARRRVVARAVRLGFDETDQGRVALVVTELATNLVRHGGGGEIVAADSGAGLDVLALDRGPGMADIGACLRDGYSTAGTPGHGLGAVRRLADGFHIASWPQRGSAVLARLRSRHDCGHDHHTHDPHDIAGLVVPMPGQEACGDAWSAHVEAGGCTVFVVDGLGHGPEAATAAHQGVLGFQRHKTQPLVEVLGAVHAAMRPTRGGAVALARVDRAGGMVGFAGVGNIGAQVIGPDGKVRRMVSHNGTAGHNAHRLQAFDYPCAEGLLVLHSDGVAAHWTLDRYPGALHLDPLLLAALLYRDHGRRRDDVVIVVARLRALP